MGMKTAFVTGGSGFIGSHVVSRLLRDGWCVRALRRAHSILPEKIKDAGWVMGDIRNIAEVRRAMGNADAVFHIAADYRLWSRDPKELYESNVTGTRNVLQAALENSVPRVVYTSSVGTLGLNACGRPADETTPVCIDDMAGDYKRSKYLAEREAEKFISRGLPLVMVHPSTPVGPGDSKPTPTGRIVVDYLNHRMPAYINTGLNIIHVEDVAQGHLLALERGRVGEKYILGNHNMSLFEIFRMLERVSGVPAPRFQLPHAPILWLARLCGGISRITGKEPLIPPDAVKMAKKLMYFDASKAVLDLGLPQRPVYEALSDAVSWFCEHGYVSGPLPLRKTAHGLGPGKILP